MGLASVRLQLSSKLIEMGYQEWEDAFPIDNIPSTMLDNAFHITVDPISGSAGNSLTHLFTIPVNIRILKKGFRYPTESIDACLQETDTILAALLAPSYRLAQDGCVKDIVPIGVECEPLGGTNDNVTVSNIRLEFRMILKF